jgi:colanic acid biosynthesis glycosyl transferase WcaI
MRILVIGINYAPDLVGVAKYNTELCEAFASFGHQVRVVTAPPYYPAWRIPDGYRGWRYQRETVNGVSITRSPTYVPTNPTGARRLVHHASFALTSLLPVLTTSLRWRPDVVFAVAPSLMSAASAARIAGRVGALSWLHLQDFEVDAAFDLGLLSNRRLRDPMVAIERNILRSFDHVSTISSQMLARLVAKGVDKHKIVEVRNWTDTTRLLPRVRNTSFRAKLHLNDSHFVALYSGTISNKQGLELIVEAARNLDGAGSNIRFVLCGEGPHKKTLQTLADGLSNVQFLPLQGEEDFGTLLCTADVHLLPQRAEAADLVLPSKLGGILASGKPAIVMTRPETGLAAEVGNGGLIIPPGDVGALTEAVRRLSTDPSLGRTLGKNARTIALARWDKATILTALQQKMMQFGTQQRASADASDPLSEEAGLRPTKSNADA